MAVTYPIEMPSAPAPTVSTFGVGYNNVSHLSLNRTRQVIGRPGDLLGYEFTLPPMLRAQAAAWQAFGMKLGGTLGTFNAGDPDAKTPRGTVPGTPLVAGGSQTGEDLATDGWTVSQTGILLEGDWIQIGTRLYMVVEDADSDGSGNATLTIRPKIWSGDSPANNASIVTANPKGIFRLLDDRVSWDANQMSVYGMKFSAIQAIDT